MLKFLKAEKVAELEASIELNKEKYIKGESLVKESDYLKSGISIEEIKLKQKEGKKTYDLENTIYIYELLKELTPLEASDERIWVGMSHSKYGMEYIKDRWDITEETKIGVIKDRYFSNYKRNTFARLWWYGYISYNKKYEDPYKLTKILLKNQDIAFTILDSGYTNNKELFQRFLEVISEMPKYPSRDCLRTVSKEISRMSEIVIVDELSKKDIEGLFSKYLKKAV